MKKIKFSLPCPDKADLVKAKDTASKAVYTLGKKSRSVRRASGRSLIRFGTFLHGSIE